MADAVRDEPGSEPVRLRVGPRARGGGRVAKDAVRLRVQAPPVDGAANQDARRFLVRTLGVRPGDVELVTGERGRDKVVVPTALRPRPCDRCWKADDDIGGALGPGRRPTAMHSSFATAYA